MAIITKICTNCKLEKNLDSFRNDKRGKLNKEAKCRDCMNAYNKKYYSENKEYYRNYYKGWADKNQRKINNRLKKYRNTDKWRKYLLDYKRDRKNAEPLYKLKDNLRNNIRCAFHNKGYKKNSSTRKIIGVDFDDLLEYLNNNPYGFKVGDDNIDLDHIIPISVANSKEELLKLNHYTNLQLLPSKYNQHIKRDKRFNRNHFEEWFLIKEQ